MEDLAKLDNDLDLTVAVTAGEKQVELAVCLGQILVGTFGMAVLVTNQMTCHDMGGRAYRFLVFLPAPSWVMY